MIAAAASLCRALAALVALLVLTTPGLAAACAVCTAGRDEENQLAFLLSTLFMSALPLIAIGTLVFVLWRRVQKLELEREAATGSVRAREGETAAATATTASGPRL